MSPKVQMLTFYFKRFKKQLYLKIFRMRFDGIIREDIDIMFNILKILYIHIQKEKTV